MSTVTTKSKRTKGSYCFNESFVRDAFASIQKFLGEPPTLDLEVKDVGGEKHRVRGSSVDEVLDSILTRHKRITGIYIRGSNYKAKPAASSSLWMEPNAIEPLVWFEATGDSDQVSVLRGDIQSLLDAARMPYAWLYPHGGVFFVGAVVVAALLHAGLLWLYPNSHPLATTAGVVIILIGAVAIRTWLFPPVIFDIGRSGDWAKGRVRLRRLILVMVGLALIVGVVSSVLGDYLKSAISKF